MFQGIVDRDILQNVIKAAKSKSDVKAMSIWGAFTDEVPGIHLGHLHMINKLWDLGKQGIRTSICINEAPVLDPDKRAMQNLVKRHAGITASMLHVLSDLATGARGLDAIYVGREETEKLCRDHPREFNEAQQDLEKARWEIESKFVPLQAMGRPIPPKIIRESQSEICASLELEEQAFRELVELFVVRNKAHAGTRWASEFGATIHLMKDRPSFLLVGERHGYIWALYNCMFRRAGIDPIPVVRVGNFMDCVGEEPMNSRRPENCICLVESEEIVRDNFAKGVPLTKTDKMFALRDVFEKLIFAHGESVVINRRPCADYQSVLDAGKDRMDSVVDAAVNFLRQYSSVVPILSRIILAESPRTSLTMDNRHVLNYVSEGVPIPELVAKLNESVNQTPRSCRALYDQVLEKAILGGILDPLAIDPGLVNQHDVLAAFDKVRALIRATRDMDVLPYQIAKRHRDHYYHQINVGGLGARLLDIRSSNGMPLWKYVAQSVGLEGNDEVKERKAKAVWWIAALLHDHAYGLAHAITFLPDLVFLKEQVAGDPVGVKRTFEAHESQLNPMMASHIATKVFRPLYDNNPTRANDALKALVREWLAPSLIPTGVNEASIYEAAGNHGVIGAINLLSHISAKDLEGEWQSAFEAIAAAILVHHLPKKPDIWFDQRPLSFLLAFVDEIQEWSRLRMCDKHRAALEKVELRWFYGPSEEADTLYFREDLEVIFLFGDDAILKEIEWDRERFHQDKVEGLGRLILPDTALRTGFPRQITWREEYGSKARQRRA